MRMRSAESRHSQFRTIMTLGSDLSTAVEAANKAGLDGMTLPSTPTTRRKQSSFVGWVLGLKVSLYYVKLKVSIHDLSPKLKERFDLATYS